MSTLVVLLKYFMAALRHHGAAHDVRECRRLALHSCAELTAYPPSEADIEFTDTTDLAIATTIEITRAIVSCTFTTLFSLDLASGKLVFLTFHAINLRPNRLVIKQTKEETLVALPLFVVMLPFHTSTYFRT